MALPFAYNLRNLRQRWRTSLLALGGIALVVAVLVVLVAMSNGVRATLRATGTADNAIVVQKGSGSELTSGIASGDAGVILADGRVARGADGQPLASPEMVVVANLTRRGDGQPTNVLIRGVTGRAYVVRKAIRVVEGRPFTPGLDEVIVGRRIHDRIAELELGETIRLKRRDWRIVGIFTADGSGFESEVWGDAGVMRQVFNRQGGWQSLTLRLTSPGALAPLAADLGRSPQFQVEVKEERAYYAEQAGGVASALLFLAGFVSVVMGVGAVFGAMNTMNGIVAARAREIGTLRALGFRRRTILLGFLLESVLLSLAGGLLGVLLALPAHGFTTATANQFSELAFAFRITPGGIAVGLGFAVAMGAIGGLLPALRAARVPITASLREG
jgi:ABC-type lipoprotein release transport system permease subunit